MSTSEFKINVKKFLSNPLLRRKQFVLEIHHGSAPNVSKDAIRKALQKTYKVPDINCIVVFGFRTQFGGGVSTGFGLIYDSSADCKRFEKNYRLVRMGIISKTASLVSRRAKKDIKNRKKKVRGKEKSKISGVQKK